jgi:sugar/nucleoside kinase (ribokinase family)
MGESGSLVSPAAGRWLSIPAIRPPEPVVDTTGAGDAYVAGFIAALARGMQVESAARVAAATAAWSVTALGATAGVRGWDETCQLAGFASSESA